MAVLLNSTTTVGSVVKYECDEDYWLDGPAELFCTKDGKWSGDAPVCELVTCETPHVPPGSFVVGYDYNVHSKITYNCDPGHVLRGNPTLECLENGEWSADAPFCEYIDCGPLTAMPFGTIKYATNTTYVGSEVAFSCSQSHKLSGVPKRTCLESGVWSDSSPKCEATMQCGATSKLKHTIIRNPTQIPTNGECQYNIEAYSENVCQLLIEFQRFQLAQPVMTNPGTNSPAACVDYFEVGKLKLCGNNAQQHLYIPFKVATGLDMVHLNFVIKSVGASPIWTMNVTQLECPAAKARSISSFSSYLPFMKQNNINDIPTVFKMSNNDIELLAPDGCDQYYTQSQGVIRSFNYDKDLKTIYPPDLNYVICVKNDRGSNAIRYTVEDFSLGVENTPVPQPPYDENCHGTSTTFGRVEDYLMIPQATLQDKQPTYYCGDGLVPNDVITASAPFTMYFKSDSMADITETGFSFKYQIL